MANYETLKSAIQDVVKTNGNNEITGALLQQSLLAMINSLGAGYQYMGVATPTMVPGTPDQRVFYIANGKGIYTNFDGIVVSNGEIAILKYDSAWHKDITNIASKESILLIEAKNMGIFGDAIEFHTGKYPNRSGSLTDDSNGYYSDMIPVYHGEKFKITAWVQYGNPCLYVMYDKNGNVVSYDNTTEPKYGYEIEITDESVSYIRFGSYQFAPYAEIIGYSLDDASKIAHDVYQSLMLGIEVIDLSDGFATGNYIDGTTGNVVPYQNTTGISRHIRIFKGDTITIKEVFCNIGIALVSYFDENTNHYIPLIQGTGNMRSTTFVAEKDGLIAVCISTSTLSRSFMEINHVPNYKPFLDMFKKDGELLNLFDANMVTEGKYILWNGSFVNDERMCVSDYIPIENGKTYSFLAYPGIFGSSAARLILYDSNKSLLTSQVGSVSDEIAHITINVANAKYCRLNVASYAVTNATSLYEHTKDLFMFVEGAEYPSEYIPFGEHYKQSDKVEKDYAINPLLGKAVVFTGDSICHGISANDGKNGWAGRIGRNNKMSWVNRGISGGTFTKNASWGNFCIAETDFGDNPNYIIIEGGTNDADRIGSNESLFGSFNLSDYSGNFDINTFCGALESLFKRVTNDYPISKIGYIVAQKMTPVTTGYDAEHNTKRRFFETAMAIAKKWGIPILNLWDGCILNPSNPSHYTEDSNSNLYTDGQHLTSKGYEYVSPIIEKWMRTL